MKALEITFLVATVTVWALWNDRNGDEHKGLNDVFWESFIILVCSALVYWYEKYDWYVYMKSLVVATTGFGLLFPYLFNWYWHNKWYMTGRIYYIFNHLSNKSWPDRWPLWRKIGWFGRLLVYCILFASALIWFIL